MTDSFFLWFLCYFHCISVDIYGIQVECHEIPWDTWHPGGMLWNSMECHGRYAISMAFQ